MKRFRIAPGRYSASAWMVVNRRGGLPKINKYVGDGQMFVYATKKEAKLAAFRYKNCDVVKVALHYEWEWLPKE